MDMNEQKSYITPKIDYWSAEALNKIEASSSGSDGGTGEPLTYCSNKLLTLEQMTVNADYILRFLLNRGWTRKAVCAMLGNMQTESWINPGVWQNFDEGNLNLGFGLVQWSPASKYFNWANEVNQNPYKIYSQLNRILYEVENDIQYTDPNMTFEQFSHSTASVYDLAMLFLRYYEKPKIIDQPIRGTQAEYWYDVL